MTPFYPSQEKIRQEKIVAGRLLLEQVLEANNARSVALAVGA